MIITKMVLPRRTFLRGLGATVALPLLDAMVPALTPIVRTAAQPIGRLGFFYIPNGIHQNEKWVPATVGSNIVLPQALEALAPVQQYVNVFTKLDNKMGEGMGDGNGGHPRGMGAWLNGAHPKKTEGADVRAGITVDQIAAAQFAKETQIPSLEIGLDGNQVLGNCDNGYSCLYQSSLAWRTETQPLPVENNPGVVFERMFGDGGDPAKRKTQLGFERSRLDSVTEELSALQRTLGVGDRNTVNEYLDSVREVEQRIQRAQQSAESSVETPERPWGIPPTFAEHMRLMMDLQVLAYRSDITRVVTFLVAREASNRIYPEVGVTVGHHSASHHGENPENKVALNKINAYHITYLSELAQKMKAIPDGDGTLLDHSLMLMGSGMGDGNLHSTLDLTCVVVGGAGGMKGNRHLRYAGDPFASLLLSMLDKVGVQADRIGDGTKALDLNGAPVSTLSGV